MSALPHLIPEDCGRTYEDDACHRCHTCRREVAITKALEEQRRRIKQALSRVAPELAQVCASGLARALCRVVDGQKSIPAAHAARAPGTSASRGTK